MVKVKDDLTGRVFGRLTVLEQAEDYIRPNGKHEARWKCQCSCSDKRIIIVRSSDLKSKHTLSCGCYKKDRSFETTKKYNKYDLSGDYGIGWTSNTNKEFYFDLEDYDKIKDYCWFEDISKKRYHMLEAYDSSTHKKIKMHHIIGFKNCDHVDRNPLNNRKCNLRSATYAENSYNRSIGISNKTGIIGVSWSEKKKCWIASLETHGKKYIKYFKDKNDAIRERLLLEKEYFVQFAPQQHLFEQYGIEVN